MAVRDQEPGAEAKRSGRELRWKEALSHTPSGLLVGGLLMYAYLSICYDRFYSQLGVDPLDVGLTYTGTLARSSGFVIVYLVVALFALQLFLFVNIPAKAALRRPDIEVEKARPLLRWIPPFLVAMFMFFLLAEPYLDASIAANDARSGRAVAPIHLPRIVPIPIPPLPVLVVRANPVTVEPAGKPEDAPAAARLKGRRLLYLGQANGTAVLYDASVRQAIHVQMGSVILRVSNCTAKRSPDPACKQP